jgi:hypothetical protein
MSPKAPENIPDRVGPARGWPAVRSTPAARADAHRPTRVHFPNPECIHKCTAKKHAGSGDYARFWLHVCNDAF